MTVAKSPVGRTRRGRHTDLLPYALVLPLAVIVIGLALVPAGVTIVQSFYRVSVLDPPTRFFGWGNFRALLQTPEIRSSLVNTGGYVGIGVALSTLLGLGMALLLRRPFRGRSLVFAIVILPWALPGVVEGLVWSGIFDPNYGLLNSVLTDLHLTSGYHVFLGAHRFATVALIELVQVWQITPLSVLLIFAVLQLIPDELYEAARIDGCGPWAMTRRLTIPLVRPGIAIAMVQALVATLNVFDQPYVLNGAAPTAASLQVQTYFQSFQNLDFGAGYALSLFITVATMVLALGVVKLVYRQVEF